MFFYFVLRYVTSNVTTSDDKQTVADLEKNIIKRKAQLYELEQSLPQKNSLYLKVCNKKLLPRVDINNEFNALLFIKLTSLYFT